MYHRYLISITLGLFFGIIFAFRLNFSSQIFLVSFVICVLNIFIYKFSKRSFGVFKSKIPLIISLFFFFISIGVVLGQVDLAKNIERGNSFSGYISQKESFTGTVTKVEKGVSSQKFILRIEGEENFKIKVVTGLLPEYISGEGVLIRGKVATDEVFLPDGEAYMESISTKNLDITSRVDGDISFPKIEKLESFKEDKNLSQRIFSYLENLKTRFVIMFKNNFSYNAAALASGTTLGDDTLFVKEDIEAFRLSGLSHIIVLSGFNITILIFAISQILLFLNIRLRLRIFFSLFFIFLFIVFVGAGPSLVRAGIMGATLLFATVFGRQYFAKQALFLSAFIMMIENPSIVVYDISFHLSFLATFALLYVSPLLENKYIFKIENIGSLEKNIKEIFRVSLAIQLIIIPYLVFAFGKFSLLSIFLNILVLPVVPLIMLFSFFSILFFPLGKLFVLVFGFLVNIFSSYVFALTHFVHKISFNNFSFHISWLALFIIYTFLIFILIFENKRRKIYSYLNKK